MQAPEFLGPLALIFLAALGAAFLMHRLKQRERCSGLSDSASSPT
jgi:hypothetical protein